MNYSKTDYYSVVSIREKEKKKLEIVLIGENVDL
jgi:hypothetical protein